MSTKYKTRNVFDLPLRCSLFILQRPHRISHGRLDGLNGRQFLWRGWRTAWYISSKSPITENRSCGLDIKPSSHSAMRGGLGFSILFSMSPGRNVFRTRVKSRFGLFFKSAWGNGYVTSPLQTWGRCPTGFPDTLWPHRAPVFLQMTAGFRFFGDHPAQK